MTTFIVTGASSGFGKCIAEALEKQGVSVIDISLETGFDISNRWNVESFRRNYCNDVGDITGIINCAGIAHLSWFEEMSYKDYERVMEVNCGGILTMVKTFLSDLASSKGVICNILSTAATNPMTNSFAYNASKGAALMMTKQMARELIKTHGITIFGVSPNKLMDTGMTALIDQKVQSIRSWTETEAIEHQMAGNGNLKYTDPHAVAEVLAFILAQRSRWEFLNGAILQMGI